ncbi:hypothetical protein LSAT2_025579 [Lamellibrachia satsuma]|nr:hypothetical protein LSAT2_025579 [Lamellibrachia satsuma]
MDSRKRASDTSGVAGRGGCDPSKNSGMDSLPRRYSPVDRHRSAGGYGQATAATSGRPSRRQYDDSSLLSPGSNRLRPRRLSDPGRVSLSPLRGVTQLNCDIAEEGENEDDPPAASPPHRFSLLGHARSRSPGIAGTSRRPQPRSRSNSLPAPDPRVFEVGEAIGALAGSKNTPVVTMSTLEPIIASHPAPGRRKSVSIESPSLASISEEGATVKPPRRFSTPNVTLDATAAVASLKITEPSAS